MEFCPVCMLRAAIPGASSFEEAVKPTSEQPPHRFDHYELVTGGDGVPVELGRGAMGVTYKALDINLRCPVTVKVISGRYLGDESARARFLREARAAASVRHPNVASVFHLGRTGGSYFYAMEFVEGETLQELIKRTGTLEVKLALDIATQVAAGLAAIHEQNLVDRDIKPTKRQGYHSFVRGEAVVEGELRALAQHRKVIAGEIARVSQFAPDFGPVAVFCSSCSLWDWLAAGFLASAFCSSTRILAYAPISCWRLPVQPKNSRSV